jgi:hypothetical protein
MNLRNIIKCKLSNNYTYRFIRDDAKVLAICRKKQRNDTLILNTDDNDRVLINPLRYKYYTEPVVGADGFTRNTLLTFATPELCSQWMESLTNSPSHTILSNTNDTIINSELDLPPPSTFSEDIHSIEFSVSDMQSVSADLRVALMVVLQFTNETYDVYYYNFKLKQRNF